MEFRSRKKPGDIFLRTLTQGEFRRKITLGFGFSGTTALGFGLIPLGLTIWATFAMELFKTDARFIFLQILPCALRLFRWKNLPRQLLLQKFTRRRFIRRTRPGRIRLPHILLTGDWAEFLMFLQATRTLTRSFCLWEFSCLLSFTEAILKKASTVQEKAGFSGFQLRSKLQFFILIICIFSADFFSIGKEDFYETDSDGHIYGNERQENCEIYDVIFGFSLGLQFSENLVVYGGGGIGPEGYKKDDFDIWNLKDSVCILEYVKKVNFGLRLKVLNDRYIRVDLSRLHDFWVASVYYGIGF